jgi:hypothetical protein
MFKHLVTVCSKSGVAVSAMSHINPQSRSIKTSTYSAFRIPASGLRGSSVLRSSRTPIYLSAVTGSFSETAAGSSRK